MIQVAYWDIHCTIKRLDCFTQSKNVVQSILQECGFESPRHIFKEYSYVALVKGRPAAIVLAAPSQKAPIAQSGQAL